MNSAVSVTPATSEVSATQNWQAYLSLKLSAGTSKTSLIPQKRYGPLSVQRPFYPELETCHVYLLHPPGGVVGGDQLTLDIEAEAQSRALITTPGATKFYFSAGQTAEVRQNLSLQQNAILEFLPQENIYFPGAQVNACTRLDVSNNSVAMLWEKHCFGRPANQETFTNGQVISKIEVYAEKRLIFTEKQRIDAQEIHRASGLRGAPVIGTLLIYGPGITSLLLNDIRAINPVQGISGITQLSEKLTLIRYMGQSTADVNDYFIALWTVLRPVIIQRQSCIPRIWNT